MDEFENINIIRKQFSDFLKFIKKDNNRFVYRDIFKIIEETECSAYLFGGAVRDIYLLGKEAIPNDFDIVFLDNGIQVFVNKFDNVERNNFGGYKIKYNGVSIDVWEIENTWAFKNNLVPYYNDISNILNTTFLNIESILLELNPRKGAIRKVVDNGFFESLNRSNLEINLDQNPFLDLSYSRIIHFSLKNRMSISENLIVWMKRNFINISIDAVIQKYEAKYGLLKRDKKRILVFFKLLSNSKVDVNLSNFFMKEESHQKGLF